MDANSQHSRRQVTKLLAAIALLAVVLAGCGGGGGGGQTTSGGTSSNSGTHPTEQGTGVGATITSRNNGTTYALNIYLPPASAGARTSLPVMYVLDGDWWYSMAAAIAQSKQAALIIVGINTMGQRAHDYVPPNTCTPDGGGNVAYLAFLRDELLPYIEGTYGGNPNERTLFGHSHGGSFVFYALFAEAAGQHSFKTYLPSDASLDCMPSEVSRWEQTYASAYTDLPVRVHQSYATVAGNFVANAAYAFTITQRNYGRLTFTARPYQGNHTGILPEVLDDAIGFAIAGSP